MEYLESKCSLSFYEMAYYFYRRKNSYDEYEKNGLNNLLERLYKTAVLSGEISSFKPLYMFNAAYSIAVAMINFSDIALMNIHRAIFLIVEHDVFGKYPTAYQNDYVLVTGSPEGDAADDDDEKEKKYEADIVLCKWMVYSILHLQANLSVGMQEYLENLRSSLESVLAYGSDKQKQTLAFTRQYPKMIDAMNERFCTDLYPCANIVIDSDLYSIFFRKINDKNFCEILTYYPTQEEQHAFLDTLWEPLKHQSPCAIYGNGQLSFAYKMLFTEKEYKDYSSRVDQGEFLVNHECVNVISGVLPELPAAASEKDDEFRKKCQQTLDLYSSKIEAMEALLASERKKNEFCDMASIASMKMQEFNQHLENKYRNLQEKYEDLKNWKREAELKMENKHPSISKSRPQFGIKKMALRKFWCI